MMEIHSSGYRKVLLPIVAGMLVASAVSRAHAAADRPAPVPASRSEAAERYLQAIRDLPLSFQPDESRPVEQGRFVANSQGYRLRVSADSAALQFPRAQGDGTASLHMSIIGANPHAHPTDLVQTATRTNYFIGDSSKWRTDLPNYTKVGFHDVYPGVDIAYYGNGGQLEYDFAVAPGARPEQIRLRFPEAAGLKLDDRNGDLLIHMADGSEVRHGHPALYQQSGRERIAIDGRYRVLGHDLVGFQVAHYDRSLPLIIDPTVTFTRFVEGSGTDQPFAITIDNAGYSYITGVTDSKLGFPFGGNLNVAAALPQKKCPLPITYGFTCPNAAFIMKLSPSGNVVSYSYFGSNGLDVPLAITTDDTWVYVAGETTSSAFGGEFANLANSGPLFINGQTYARGTTSASEFDTNAFVAMFTTSLLPYRYTTFGGTGSNSARAIAVDASHAVYTAGTTCAADFPTSALLSRPAVQAHSGGGCDAFVTKIDPYGYLYSGYSTYLGGSYDDEAYGIAVDSSGSAWVTGSTCSTDFPGAPWSLSTTGLPTADGRGCTAFITKLDPTGAATDFSLYLGGVRSDDDVGTFPIPYDSGYAIALDHNGGAFVGGATFSPNFYVTADAAQKVSPCPFPCEKGFVAYVSAQGAVQHSTYLASTGGSEVTSLAVNQYNQVYAGGSTGASTGFPGAPAITPNPTAGFLTRLSATLSSVVSTTFLGEAISGVALSQPVPILPSVQPTTTLYTTGTRLAPAGINQQLDHDAGTDGFVVQLTDVGSNTIVITPPRGPVASVSINR